MTTNSENSLEKKRQEQIKGQIRKKIQDDAKPKCLVCHKYLFDQPKCACHDTVADSETSVEFFEAASLLLPIPEPQSKKAIQDEEDVVDEHETSYLDLALDGLLFNPEVISELLSKGILHIDNNLSIGMLSFKTLFHPSLLSDVQRHELNKYIHSVLNALTEFKNKHNITSQCVAQSKDEQGKVQLLPLSISLPTPNLYEAFINHLAKNLLLPFQNINQQPNQKVHYPNGMNHFGLNPLSTRLEPNTKSKKIDDNEASIRPRKPTDINGPRPKD